jgi:hypothetical protein
MIEGLTAPPSVDIAQPVAFALPGEARAGGTPEDILDRARTHEEEEALLWTHPRPSVKAYVEWTRAFSLALRFDSEITSRRWVASVRHRAWGRACACRS